MGNKNPLRDVVDAGAKYVMAPALVGREIAKTVGADGVVNAIDGVKNAYTDIGNGAIDLANDEAGKQKRAGDAREKENENAQRANAAASASQAQSAETARMESDRMAGGSASRTLLTGPAGLEDEEKSISRRTLSGR
jgi:hypothetical protein